MTTLLFLLLLYWYAALLLHSPMLQLCAGLTLFLRQVQNARSRDVNGMEALKLLTFHHMRSM